MTDVHLHAQSSNSPEANELRAFFAVANLWGLGADQQITLLGSPSRSTYFKWKKEGGSVTGDTEERISHLMAIFKALQILFPDASRADAWLRRPNRFFLGQSALDVMLGGRLQDIIRVREYVDAQRGG
jgi:uncharacterized protein (DUF2384 family)